jgi:hypothetical protein
MGRLRLLKGKMRGGQAAAYGAAVPVGAVVARALFDEGDDPGLTDRVGPPVSEREAMAESDKQSRRRPNRTSGAGDGQIGQAEQATVESDKRKRRRPNQTSGAGDGPTGSDREGGGGPWLG